MSPERRRALRRAAPLVLIVAGAVAAVLVAGRPAGQGPLLDPENPGAMGTKALVDGLTELGSDVRLDAAVDEADARALLLADTLDEDAADSLREWVRDGGTLVVADPRSRFAPDVAGPARIGPLEASMARDCDLPALAGVERIVAPDGVVYDEPADGAVACFPRGEGFWLVARAEGEGTVVALGGPLALTNAALGEFDNALLAAALLDPSGGGRLVVLRPAPPGQGDATLRDLVADRVLLALLQLGIAFAIVVLWRSRRLGAPVREPQPVQIAGSELVTAVGNLLQQTGARGQAARLLRDNLRRELAERLGLPADSPPAAVAAAAARRSGDRADDLTALLDGPEPAGEAELVALAADLEQARGAALATPAPTKEPARVH